MGQKKTESLTPGGRGVAAPEHGAEIVALPLAARLVMCAERFGGKRALAEAAGMSESQFFRYLNGDSEMSAAKAVGLARAAGVDVGWLLTGDGKPEGARTDGQPAFNATLMEDILRVLTEVLVDFEWRLNPSQRAKYAAYAYQALRLEEEATGQPVDVTVERLMEGLWYFGKTTFDELLKAHSQMLAHTARGTRPEAWELAHYAQAVSQGCYQFYNSTGGDAVNRWLSLQISASSAERLLNLLARWKDSTPKTMTWLDVGCGNGRELEYVKRHMPELDVYGVEIARAGLAQCQRFARTGLWPEDHVVEADAACLPFADMSMSMVYCRSVLYRLPYFGDPEAPYGLARAVAEMARVCAPRGWVVIVVPLTLHGGGLTFIQPLDRDVLVDLATGHGLTLVGERHFELPHATPGYRKQVELVFEKPAGGAA